MSLNVCLITGNLTAAPELKELKSGTSVAQLRVAVNEHFTSRDGKEVERTLFIDVIAWDKLAEHCQTYLDKGSRVTVEGTLQQDTWEDRDGKSRSQIKIRADQIHFLNKVRSESEAAPAGTGRRDARRSSDDDRPERSSNSNRRFSKSR